MVCAAILSFSGEEGTIKYHQYNYPHDYKDGKAYLLYTCENVDNCEQPLTDFGSEK